MKSRIAIIASLVAWSLGSGACSKADPVIFSPYSRDALDAAHASHKPAIVFATAAWCGPCQRLHHGALSDPEVKAALDPFTRLEIDYSDRSAAKTPALEEHRIEGFPTLVFFSPSGQELDRLVGPYPSDAIIAAAKKAQGAQ
jgi:thioredoxin:protein disulfide reductase